MKLKIKLFNEGNKHYFKMAFSNKLRSFLTIMGIAIITATIVIIGYFVNNNITKYENMNRIEKNMIVCQNLTLDQTNEIISTYEDINAYKYGDYIFQDIKLNDESNIHIGFVGIENQNHMNLIDPFSMSIFGLEIVNGRNFDDFEFHELYKSIIIDEVSYDFMISQKMIENDFFIYNFKGKDYKYKIVGIVSSNINQIEKYNLYTDGYSNDMYLSIFYPKEEINNLNNVLLVGKENLSSLTKILSQNYDKAIFHDYNHYYNSYNKLKDEAINNYMGVVVGIVVCSIIAISIFMVFSIKERIEEIGIRKAIGATSLEIFYQFIFEYGILGLIGVIVGGIIGLDIFLLSTYIINFNNVFFIFEFSIIPVLTICLFSYLIVIFCAIIPGIISSKIKVVDALRFE